MRFRRIFFFLLVTIQTIQAQSYVPEYNNKLVVVQPTISVKAFAFNLSDVELLESPFRQAMRMDSAYLLLLSPDRMLYRFYQNAGLPVKDSLYGGWEREGLSGHTLGHYLSAASMMYASTRNERFRLRVDYIVDELIRCQDARKTGYIGAIPNEDTLFARVTRGDIKSSGFDLNGGWSPWYTVHKVMAGLGDAYLYAGNKKALQAVVRMADWTYSVVNHLPDSLRLKMLNCEYGGMNEVLANIYSYTGNKKYLDLSYKFRDDIVMGKLARREDPMPGKHSNTNVPKAIGSARQYELTGNPQDETIASFFWETMVYHHSYVIGGNSNYEYCGQPDSLNDRLSDNTSETCNTYNMLKLTRHLFAWSPSGKLMDYYERALYNHILASQNPKDGMMCYFVPLRMGTQKQFSDSFQTFTCCVGSGIENHAKYAEQVFSHDGGTGLFVNLFIPARLYWNETGVQVTQETRFPESGGVRITLQTDKPRRLQIRLRKPFWLAGNMEFRIRDDPRGSEELVRPPEENGYYVIDRNWQSGEVIHFQLPMDLYSESMPDNSNRIAFKYGPLVLAGILGYERPDPMIGIPVLLTANRNVKDWVVPEGQGLSFKTSGTGKPFDIRLVPFYTVYDQYYSVYWDYFTPDDWTRLQKDYQQEKQRMADLEKRTIDYFRIGEMQPERDHQLQATERSYVDDAMGRKGREARSGHHFSFDMSVGEDACNLVLTYIGDDKDRVFDIYIDAQKLATVEWKGGKTGKFYDVEYPLPDAWTRGKSRLRVKVDASHGKTAGRIFGARIVKKAVIN